MEAMRLILGRFGSQRTGSAARRQSIPRKLGSRFPVSCRSHERSASTTIRQGTRADAHLIEVRTTEYPWLPRVYKHLSGYVHFSGSHIYDSVLSADKSEGSIEFEVTEFDSLYPESSWIEVVECFREGTEFLAKYLN